MSDQQLSAISRYSFITKTDFWMLMTMFRKCQKFTSLLFSLARSGLLVGLEETEGSVLCLYDLGLSRVVKAVVIPGRVSSPLRFSYISHPRFHATILASVESSEYSK